MTTLLKKDYQYSSVLWEEVMQRVQEIIRDEYNISPYVSPTLNRKTPSPFRIWSSAQGTETLYAGAWHKEYTISVNHYLKTEDSERFYKKLYQESERLYQLFFNNQGTKSTEILGFFGGEPEGIQISQEGDYFRIEVLFTCQVFRADDVVYVVTAPSSVRASTRAIEKPYNFWSLDFDGSDDSVNCGSDSSLDDIFDGGGSVSVWFNSSAINATHTIVSKKGGGTGYWAIRISNNSGNTGRFYFIKSFDSSHYTTQQSSRDINANTWYHAVVVYNADSDSNRITAYLNGELVTNMSTTMDGTSAPSGTRISDASQDFYIGKDNQYEFLGQISEVSLFNTELTSSAISSMYNNGQPLLLTENQGSYKSSSNLVAYYRMGSGEGDDRSTNGTIVDQSVNTNNGTMANFDGLDFRTNVPQIYDKALFSNSLVFDGTDDYIDCGSNSSLDDIWSGGGSISAWVNCNTASVNHAIASQAGNGNQGWFITLEDYSTHHELKFHAVWSGDDLSYYTGFVIPINTWTHIVVTYNSDTYSNEAKIYLNGSEVATTKQQPTSGNSYASAAAYSFEIGRKNTGGDHDFVGNIADVAVYNSILDATNVTAMYNSGKPIDLTCDAGNYNNANNLVGYWKMGDGYLDELPSATHGGAIYDQVTPVEGSDISIYDGEDVNVSAYANIESDTLTSVQSGCAYKFNYTITNYVSGSFRIRQSLGASSLDVTGGTGNGNGDYEFYLLTTNTNNFVIDAYNLGFVGTISNYEVRKVEGNVGLAQNMNASAQSISVPT
tara:strand:- start:4 stop:2337 length:2334 start_codon:yes stop_codon:yes gene_type:complete